ncbi:hypothetical protein V1264_004428 [Littorina saxatilis]|uniref:DUF3504 domain-containing protein n=1 Tax=Littorina saxatilis TaxID=31220 RepID=A0AAN9B1D6_9CAEN
MPKDTFGFEVKMDQTTGKQYVIKRFDELTKNHRAGDEELVTGVMPETGDSSCPVYSYNKYLSLLNPKCERLWQFPVNTFHGDDETWYENRPMGVHTMKKFMAKLSELCQLSQNTQTTACERRVQHYSQTRTSVQLTLSVSPVTKLLTPSNRTKKHPPPKN